jgi:hypothetical protein
MKRVKEHASWLAAILLLLTTGCQPSGDSATAVVPDGMKSATFAVTGMV